MIFNKWINLIRKFQLLKTIANIPAFLFCSWRLHIIELHITIIRLNIYLRQRKRVLLHYKAVSCPLDQQSKFNDYENKHIVIKKMIRWNFQSNKYIIQWLTEFIFYIKRNMKFVSTITRLYASKFYSKPYFDL